MPSGARGPGGLFVTSVSCPTWPNCLVRGLRLPSLPCSTCRSEIDVVMSSPALPPPGLCGFLLTSAAGLDQLCPRPSGESLKPSNFSREMIFPPWHRCSNIPGNIKKTFHPRATLSSSTLPKISFRTIRSTSTSSIARNASLNVGALGTATSAGSSTTLAVSSLAEHPTLSVSSSSVSSSSTTRGSIGGGAGTATATGAN